MEHNHLYNFGRRHHEEHLCEIILNLDQSFKRCHLKIFLSRTLLALVQRSGTICAILVEGIMRNNGLKLFEFGLVVQEETSFKRFLI